MAYKGQLNICSTKNCDRKHKAKGYCLKHYKSIYVRKHKPLYSIWLNIRARCSYNNHPRYADWGGRGIKMCNEWCDSYEQFAKDMGVRPTPFHQIDRKDNNGNYTPENCRWATATEQARNRRVKTSSRSGVRGVEYRAKQGYVARITVNKQRLNLGTFKTLEEAKKIRLQAEELYFSNYQA